VPADVAAVADAGVGEALARRTLIDVPEYERLTRDDEAGGEPPPGFSGEFVLHRIRDDRREYGRLRAALAA